MAGEIRIPKDELDGLYERLSTGAIDTDEFTAVTIVWRYTYGYHGTQRTSLRLRAIRDLTGWGKNRAREVLASIIDKGIVSGKHEPRKVAWVGPNPDLRASGHAFRAKLKRRAKEASAKRAAETAATELMTHCVIAGDAPMKRSGAPDVDQTGPTWGELDLVPTGGTSLVPTGGTTYEAFPLKHSNEAFLENQNPKPASRYTREEEPEPLASKVCDEEALATSATPARVENQADQEEKAAGEAAGEATAAQAESPVVLLGSQKTHIACPAVVAAADPTGELRAAAGDEAFAAWAGRLCKEMADVVPQAPCDYRRPTCMSVAEEAGECLLSKLPKMKNPGVYISQYDHKDRYFVAEDDLPLLSKQIKDRWGRAQDEERERRVAANPHLAAVYAEMERLQAQVLARLGSSPEKIADDAHDTMSMWRS